MRWNFRAAALSAVVVLLTAPLAAWAEQSRAGDSPPLEGAATTADVPANPPPGQVVTIFVPSEPVEAAPPKSKPPAKPSGTRATPAAPPAAPPPASPVVTSARSKAPVAASARGGASSAVVVPPAARGGASLIVAVARSRQPASLVSAFVTHGGGVTDIRHPGKASRGWVTVLAVAVFAEALLVTRLLLRRRRFVVPGRPPGA